MKKALAIVLLTMLVFSLVACNPAANKTGDLIKVGIVNLPPEESGYRQANVEDMNTVFSVANGYDMNQTNTGDNSEQIAAAEGYIRDGVDYLLISAASATGWDGVLASAKQAGVTVFLFDRLIETDESNFQAALVSDMATEGNVAVDWLLAQGLDEYNVILIRGQLGCAAELGRSAAVLAAQDAGKLNIVADGTGGDSWSGEEARKVVEAAIQSGVEFNVIYAQNDGMADGAVQALDAAGISHGKGGDVIIMGFDFNRFALRNVQAGIWNFDMQCNPRQAAKISEWIKAGEPYPTGIVFQNEIGVDCDSITEDIIKNMGINEDPGKLGAEAPAELIKVGIVNLPPEESGYRQANVEDMNAVFSIENGYDMSQTNTGDNSEQIAAAEGYIRDGVDYLLISAANTTGWDGVLASAKQAGVTVFLFDRLIETDESNYQAALVSDMATEGNIAVDWLLEQGLDEYNVILIRGQLGSAAELGRSAAVLAAQEAGKLNIVADGTGGDSWSGEEARKVVEAAIQSGVAFNVIYAQNDGMADGAMQALDAAGISHGKDGDVIIMGFDFNRFALRYVQAGLWNFNMQCNPRQAAKISEWIKAGLPFPTGIVFQDELDVDFRTITEEIILKMGINEDPGLLS
ncbi:MAG: substrate-binding domain-containing protein [Clostridiales bacterium]|nr:substrate-binding domain-containing protein [Clostridiales bacterium]